MLALHKCLQRTAQPGASDLLTLLVKSIQDACRSHLQCQDYVFVTGFLCVDAGGSGQERLVLSELVTQSHEDEERRSFPMKTPNLVKFQDQSKIKSDLIKPDANKITPNKQAVDNLPKQTRSKQILPRTLLSTHGNGNFRQIKQQFCSTNEHEKASKPPPVGFCKQRTDLRNLTFTIENDERPALKRKNKFASSTYVVSTTTASSAPESPQMSPDISRQQPRASESCSNKILRNSYWRKRHLRSIKSIPDVFDTEQQQQNKGNSFSQDVCKDKKEIKKTPDTSSKCEPFHFESMFCDSAFTLDSVRPQYLVDHSGTVVVGSPQSLRTNATNSNCLPAYSHVTATASPPSNVARACENPLIDLSEKEMKLTTKATAAECVIPSNENGRVHIEATRTSPRKNTEMMKEALTSQSRSQASFTASPMFGYEPSLCRMQPLTKRKRLIKWMKRIKRGKSCTMSPSDKALPLTTTSLGDFSPSWTGSILSLPLQE